MNDEYISRIRHIGRIQLKGYPLYKHVIDTDGKRARHIRTTIEITNLDSEF